MASFLNLRLSAPTKYPPGAGPPSPPKSPADDLIERQKASGAAWHLDPLRDALDFPGGEAKSKGSWWKGGGSKDGSPSGAGSGSGGGRDPSRIPAIYQRPRSPSKPLPNPPRQRTESSDALAMPTPYTLPPRPRSNEPDRPPAYSTHHSSHPIGNRYSYDDRQRPAPPSHQSAPYRSSWDPSPPPRPQEAWKNPPTHYNGGYDAHSAARPPLHPSTASSSGGGSGGPPRPPKPPMNTRPVSTPPSSSSSTSSSRPSNGTPSTPQPRPHVSASTPTKQKAHKTSPSPGPASTPADRNRCHGTTQQGHRCKRNAVSLPNSTAPSSPTKHKGQGKKKGKAVGPTLSKRALDRLGKQLARGDEEDEDEAGTGEELPKYCKLHAEQVMSEQGTFVGSSFVNFDDWINEALPTLTKIHLRQELSRPPSATDSSSVGYIYVHEMAPTSTSSTSSRTTYIKLGRSVKPVMRHKQWKSQCPSRTPIVRGFFPQAPGGPSVSISTLSGTQTVAPVGGPYHMRWERLCLLELAGWEEIERYERRSKSSSIDDSSSSDDSDSDSDSDDEEDTPARRRGKGGVRRSRDKDHKCPDCGKTHVEVFEFSPGAYERKVKEVVLRWEKWCKEVLDA